MGLLMDSLHAPVVASGPTSGVAAANDDGSDKMSLLELITEKDRVESELSALSSVLDSHGVTMNTTLTTFDGYPRDDLDIAQIRTTRARIIYLKNDYKSLMSRIEIGLHTHHASASHSEAAAKSRATVAASASMTAPSTIAETSAFGIIETPFARVNSVVSKSPADDAGLRAGDGIRSFGGVNWINHEKLTKVAEVVQRNEGRVILVKVLRSDSSNQNDEELQLQLVPRRDWGGRGLLGCHLVPA
ncbi:MAG: putative 26S proteasome regulatory subunit [Pycnora praestabilis]|nr:MAG: putative 26S proteasome regulatory subunit [Pycnora praestabilis]